MLPLNHLATGVLAEVIRRQPASAARTTFAWSVAVGPAVARATTVELRDGVLAVTPKDPRWAQEIQRSCEVIVGRLCALLGPGAVDSLRVLDAPRTSHLGPRSHA